MKPET
ncbi:hypothetical protein ABD83_16010, partial [Bacillus xiamenensis]